MALSGHVGLEGKHPPAPRAPFVQFLAATRLQVAPMVALSGHLELLGMHPLAPRAQSASRTGPGSHRASGANGGALGTPVHSGGAAGAAASAALCAAAAAANVCLAARETEVAIDANNMGVQPADMGPAAVTSAAVKPSAEAVRMGE